MENSQINLAGLKTLFFDLDDTLYPRSSGIWEMIRKRIDIYMVEEMHFSIEEVPELRHRLWSQYGTTLRGLQEEYNVDMASYIAFVHNVPIDTALEPDPALEQSLAALPQHKFIFTNADITHAQRVTARLGIAHLFEGIIDIYAMAPHCKPQPEAFAIALAVCGEPPERCLLVDDAPRNLDAARALGMTTVSIGEHLHNSSPHIDNIHDLFTLFK
jgi:putative hydrolase of the HAD superfamily